LLIQQNPSAPDSAPSYSIQTLLGVRSAPLPQLLARRLIESLSSSPHEHMASKPLLLSVALQKAKRTKPAAATGGDDGGVPSLTDDEVQAVRDIITEIDKIKMW